MLIWLLTWSVAMPSAWGVSFSSLLEAPKSEFLPVEEAFPLQVAVENNSVIKVKWQIAEGYYLYRHTITLTAKGIQLGEWTFPPGEAKRDEHFGDVEIYHQSLVLEVPASRSSSVEQETSITLQYQGCAEAGLCYPPQEKSVPISPLSLASSLPQMTQPSPSPKPGDSDKTGYEQKKAPTNESEQIANIVTEKHGWAILTFLGLGLLLSLTPCVLPMVPILAGVIVGQGTRLNTRRAFMFSLVYVLAMAFTYAIAGVLAAKFGANLQTELQRPWVMFLSSAIFIGLALSMFGLYTLQLPVSWQNYLIIISQNIRGGENLGVVLLGILSALIIGPCVTPPLMGGLLYIAQTGDLWLGGLSLFALGIGMGVPLLIIGTSLGKLLPKAGPWMREVQVFFGILLIGVAIYLVSRFLPNTVTMLLWGVLAILSATYWGAFDPLAPGGGDIKKVYKGMALVIFLYGSLLIVGATSGGGSLMQPLGHLKFSSNEPKSSLTFQSVDDLEQLQKILSETQSTVFLDFYADWCVSCQQFEQEVLPQVAPLLSSWVLLRIDMTKNLPEHHQLLQHFGLVGPPALLFFHRGQELSQFRIIGFMEAKRFQLHLQSLLSRITS